MIKLKNNQLKKINLSQSRLIGQTNNTSHETKIPHTNHNKL